MAKLSILDLDLVRKRVFIRVDFNVPLKDGTITDDTRIRASMETIQFALAHGATAVVASHLGRPKGKPNPAMSLRPIADRLGELAGRPVVFADDCVGDAVKQTVDRAHAAGAGLVLLENLRFHPEEEKNDPGFAKQLASLAGVYVNDAFGTAHRAHASTEGVAHDLPAVAGFLMLKEIEELGNVLGNPARPMAAILGGAKVSSKLAVITNLLPRVDCLLLGGGMANTFLKARGIAVGDSLVEDDFIEKAREVLADAETRGVPVLLPTDVVIADEFKADANHETVPVSAVPPGWRIMDVGPDTLETYQEALGDCGTVFWNGTLGVAEFPTFAEGSLSLAMTLADLQASVVVGGGETAALVEQAGMRDRYTHVSTGGGASLEFIEGKTLPGVAALNDRA
jgi:phosphoglycerate kinase